MFLDNFMSLNLYKQKRDFKKTSEPPPKIKSEKNSKELKYSIQEHHASHLHWDLRLEHDGVLLSWAIPKSPAELTVKDKKVKRLAIQTEDHPLDYWNFEGEIPEGNYGAGKVKLWDKGTYKLIKKNSKEIEIKISGKKLKGDFVLVKTNYGNKPEKSWLFFKI